MFRLWVSILNLIQKNYTFGQVHFKVWFRIFFFQNKSKFDQTWNLSNDSICVKLKKKKLSVHLWYWNTFNLPENYETKSILKILWRLMFSHIKLIKVISFDHFLVSFEKLEISKKRKNEEIQNKIKKNMREIKIFKNLEKYCDT